MKKIDRRHVAERLMKGEEIHVDIFDDAYFIDRDENGHPVKLKINPSTWDKLVKYELLTLAYGGYGADVYKLRFTHYAAVTLGDIFNASDLVPVKLKGWA